MKLAIFVEGPTERDVLPRFFRQWLDPRVSGRRVEIAAVNFDGVGNYLNQFPRRVRAALRDPQVIGAIGLIDFYGSTLRYPSGGVKEQYLWASRELEARVNDRRFRQHFAVHETEAWLLSDLAVFPKDVADRLPRSQQPETVNQRNTPAKRLREVYWNQRGEKYQKPLHAARLFEQLDPTIAAAKCPHLQLLLDDLLVLASGAE